MTREETYKERPIHTGKFIKEVFKNILHYPDKLVTSAKTVPPQNLGESGKIHVPKES